MRELSFLDVIDVKFMKSWQKNADDSQIPSSAWCMLIILQGRLQSLIEVSLSGAVPHPVCVPVLRERTQSRF